MFESLLGKKLGSLILALLVIWGCEREPGPGGSSSIIGKVQIQSFNEDFSKLKYESPALDDEVFIQYGEDISFGDRVKTTFDGSFEFPRLNPGEYKVFIYTEDSTGDYPGLKIPQVHNVSITESNQLIDLGTLTKMNNDAPNGNARISGKVKVMNYNSSYTVLLDEYYGMDEDVFLVMGSSGAYDDRERTSFDGSYEFDNLEQGIYTLYIYSEDSTGQSPTGIIPVVQEVEITSDNQVVSLPDFIRVD